MTGWGIAGLGLSAITCAVAAWHAGAGSQGYYESGVYGMTRRTHGWYAAVSLGLAALFAVSYFRTVVPPVPLLAVAVLVAIFYFTSFLRGFVDQD